MQISGTGIRASNTPRAVSGFTLIELLVVMLIIGVMIAVVTLSLGAAGRDRELEQERDRIIALTSYLRDQAALQNREYGMRCHDRGYQFLVLNARSGLWEALADDTMLRPRTVPAGLSLMLDVEGRRIVLPAAVSERDKPEDLVPQVMLFSSGDTSLFELTLQRETTQTSVRIAPDADSGEISASALIMPAAT
jgi:general secretion pathway protein H